jgi:hypothetical protein
VAALTSREEIDVPDDDYERGQQDGWIAKMREEGWPTTREEAMEH